MPSRPTVLLTGATGFVGRHVAARLLQSGCGLVAAVRDVDAAARRFPGVRVVRIDMNRMTSPADWTPLLRGVDAVVNCAGILQSGRGQSARAIHHLAPKALFEACVAAGVRRVVQISAVSADAEAGTEYASTKKAADDYLRSLDVDWIVLRPSLVYAKGSYGGTSALRGLAGFPFVAPVVGDGDQRFQPIHADDLAETVLRCVGEPSLARTTMDPVGPETVTLREIVLRWRAWLDMPAAPIMRVPRQAVALLARVGDLLGAGPLRTTSLNQMDYGNVSDAAGFERAIGFRPRTMADALAAQPSDVQDRWHARLYFLRPLLTAALVALWAGSAIAGFWGSSEEAEALHRAFALQPATMNILVVVFSLLDLLLAAAILIGRKPILVGAAQLVVVGGYTVALTAAAPSLWLDAYGALLKNLPILAAIGVWIALQDDR